MTTLRTTLTAILFGLALSSACDLPDDFADELHATPLGCTGPDGTAGCPCRFGASPCISPKLTCSPANVCVPG